MAEVSPLRHRHVAVQAEDFDLSAETARLSEGDVGAGAVAAFVGLVREWVPDGAPAAVDAQPAAAGGLAGQGAPDLPLSGQGHAPVHAPAPALILEHYPGMTERSIESMVDEAARRFAVRGVRVIHRVGSLALGDRIVLVAVSAAHRHAAFQCCEFLMDWLKTQAPFWKKEVSQAGARWVDARVQDDEALARWGEVPGAAANGGREAGP